MIYKLGNIINKNGPNPGGGHHLLLIPTHKTEWVYNVDVITGELIGFQDAYNNAIDDVLLLAPVPFSMHYLEEEQQDKGEDYWNVSINATLHYNADTQRLLNALKYGEYIILYHAQNYINNQYKVIGDNHNGAKFSVNFDGQDNPSKPAQFNIGCKFSVTALPTLITLTT